MQNTRQGTVMTRLKTDGIDKYGGKTMRTIIATIKPCHLDNIRNGKKLWEIRKTIPNELPFKVLCCESGSGGQIKAEFIVNYADEQNPADVPYMAEEACVSQSDAEKYANGKRVWFWGIRDMIDYCSTKGYKIRNISEFGLKRPPQSWQYVDETLI